MGSKSELLKNALNEYVDENEKRHFDHNEKLGTHQTQIEQLGNQVKDLEYKYHKLLSENIELKKELNNAKETNDKTANDVIQLKSNLEDIVNNKKHPNQDEITEFIRKLAKEIIYIRDHQVKDMKDYQDNTERKVKTLQQQLTDFVAQMNAQPSQYQLNHNSRRSPITSSLLNGQTHRGSMRTSQSQQFQKSNGSDDYLTQLDIQDSLSEMSDLGENLLQGLGKLHHSRNNGRFSGNGNGLNYSDF